MGLRRLAIAVLCWCSMAAGGAQSQPVRFLDDADVTETPAHYDLTIRFTCPVRYLSHTPAAQGSEVRINLSVDVGCGSVSEESLITPAPAVVRSIELLPLLANDAQLLIRWRLAQTFLVVPTNDRFGLRIRILREGETGETQGRVLVTDAPSTDVTTAYAVNLESSLVPISSETVQQAQLLLKGRVYTSEIDVADTHWYRLRLGPVATRAEAERLLVLAKATYPRAWLAIADENIDEQWLDDAANANNAVDAAAIADSKIVDAQADTLWSSGNQQFRGKEYAAAIEFFTQLIGRDSGKYRARALELRGIAHERRGDLALAQDDYQEFLRSYAVDKRASRVRRRLNALRAATLPGRSASGADENEEGIWHFDGGWAQYYRRDNNQLTVEDVTQNSVGQNSLLNDFDLTARYRGLDTDTRIRVSAGYNKSLMSTVADQFHVSSAFVEWSDRNRGWYGSLGRQSRVGSGTFGSFDGLFASYQWRPHFTTDVSVGMPVDSSRSGVNAQRLFETLSVNFGAFANAWEPSFYLSNQTLEGRVDRRALGAELRFFKPGYVFVGFADYDLYYQTLNSAVVVGTMQLPARWTMNLDLEHRKSPLISTRNALIGQPTSSLDTLYSVFSGEQVKQLALDRTPSTNVYSLSLARPIGERLQLTLLAQSIKTSATAPSEGSDIDSTFVGVEGIPGQGPEMIYSAQLLAASIMRAGDINIIGIRQQSGGTVETTSLGVSSRVPIWGDFRLGPQLRVDYRTFQTDQSKLWLYAPSLRLTLQRPTLQIDLEMGAELSKRDLTMGKQDSKRYFAYAGYRWFF